MHVTDQETDGNLFLEIGKEQKSKQGQQVCGDLFLSRRQDEDSRIITILADGLGSGIKASVLSTLTASMAAGCVGGRMDIRRTAEIILASLPVCKNRGLAYSTFTIVDADLANKEVRVIEHENPRFLLIRNNETVNVEADRISLPNSELSSRNHELLYSRFDLKEEDRIVFFSDGITQAGMGKADYHHTWGPAQAADYVLNTVQRQPDLSAQNLAGKLLQRALSKESYTPKDDMTCAALYYRKPRHLVVATGPPYETANDEEMARKVDNFDGRRIICGGTTADLVARELGRNVELDLDNLDPEVPPASKMAGVDLVTEGTLTLESILKILQRERRATRHTTNAAARAAELMKHSDRIHFLVGNRINNAHHDPSNPRQIDIRRNIVQRIKDVLEQEYLKETDMDLL